jgi:hypothetical protein
MLYVEEQGLRISVLLFERMQVRRQWNNTFKLLKEKIINEAKIPFFKPRRNQNIFSK